MNSRTKEEMADNNRKIDVIEDIDGNKIVVINDIRFKGKRSINWDDVKDYLKNKENEGEKHQWNARYGWYLYDSQFALPIYGDGGEIERYNVFHASMLIRHDNNGKMYLYDVLDVKKKRATL